MMYNACDCPGQRMGLGPTPHPRRGYGCGGQQQVVLRQLGGRCKHAPLQKRAEWREKGREGERVVFAILGPRLQGDDEMAASHC